MKKSYRCLGYTLIPDEYQCNIAVYSAGKLISHIEPTKEEENAPNTLELVLNRVRRDIRNRENRIKTAAMKSLGLTRVRGANGGIYWE